MFFSIILPVYNAGKTVRRAVESALSQTFKDFELIIVDDGSTDNSARICAEYKSDPRVRVITAKHAGVASARNIGIAAAAGEYITFLDSDDEYVPAALGRIYSALGNKKYDIVCFGFSVIPSGGRRWSLAPPEDSYERRDDIKANFLDIAAAAWFKSVCNKAYKSSILDERPLLEEEIAVGEDKCFNVNLLAGVGSLLMIKDELYVIHKTGTSLTEKRDLSKFPCTVKAHLYMAERLLKFGGERAPAVVRYDWAHLCLAHFTDLFAVCARNKRDTVRQKMNMVKYDYPRLFLRLLSFRRRIEYLVFASGNITLILTFCFFNHIKEGRAEK